MLKYMTSKHWKHLRGGFSMNFHGTKKLLWMVSHDLWARKQSIVFHENWNPRAWIFLLIDKMSLGAGAWKVEGPIAQKGSLALGVTMATKRAPTTQHHHTEEKFNGILTTTHTYLSRGRWGGGGVGGEEWEQNRQIISQSVTNNDPQRSQSKAKRSKAKLKYASTCQPLKTAPPPRRGLHTWGSTADLQALSRG